MERVLISFCVVCSLAILGCSKERNTENRTISPTTEAEYFEKQTTYFRDSRTDLCFARWLGYRDNGWHADGIAMVPCEAIPEQLLMRRDTASQ